MFCSPFLCHCFVFFIPFHFSPDPVLIKWLRRVFPQMFFSTAAPLLFFPLFWSTLFLVSPSCGCVFHLPPLVPRVSTNEIQTSECTASLTPVCKTTPECLLFFTAHWIWWFLNYKVTQKAQFQRTTSEIINLTSLHRSFLHAHFRLWAIKQNSLLLCRWIRWSDMSTCIQIRRRGFSSPAILTTRIPPSCSSPCTSSPLTPSILMMRDRKRKALS